jgi:tyrosyl-tRNA synthetase
MLTMDSVKLRLEREQELLTFLEFNYMILQAYDFVELQPRYGCTLQMGGSDQWGNIVNGIDLGRRMGNAQLFALTSPLITTASGAKMGKTAAARCGSTPTAVALRLLAVLAQHRGRRRRPLPASCSPTCRSTRSPGSRRSQGAEINEAKKVLATEATALVHGRAAGRGRGRDRAPDLRGGPSGTAPRRH